MMTTKAEFRHFIEAPEGSRFEFKEAKQNFSFENIIKYCVALANEGGGKIILGVSDKRPRKVVGTRAFAEPGRTEGGLYDRLHHRIPVEEYFHEGSRASTPTIFWCWTICSTGGRFPKTSNPP